MNNRKPRLYPAHITGIIFLFAAGASFFVSSCISAAILFFYVVLCIAACFLPETNFLGPVISRGRTGQPFVSLTFDDGPSEEVTRRVLDLLDRHRIKATFFVSGINAQNHPDIMADILDRGHDVGNHSFNHFPFLMFRSRQALYREIAEAQNILRSQGIETKAFRPPVGIVNPKLSPVLISLDMFCITFSCRAFDAGNRRIKNLSTRILNKVKADDIVLLHDIPGPEDGDGEYFLKELEGIITGIKNKGLRIVPLGKLISREFMVKPNSSCSFVHELMIDPEKKF